MFFSRLAVLITVSGLKEHQRSHCTYIFRRDRPLFIFWKGQRGVGERGAIKIYPILHTSLGCSCDRPSWRRLIPPSFHLRTIYLALPPPPKKKKRRRRKRKTSPLPAPTRQMLTWTKLFQCISSQDRQERSIFKSMGWKGQRISSVRWLIGENTRPDIKYDSVVRKAAKICLSVFDWKIAISVPLFSIPK